MTLSLDFSATNFYRPPTKLQEGNIFTGISLSVHNGVPM